MKIDINKKYRTRNGREVTHLYRVPDGFPSPYPWRGLAGDIEESWTEEGVYDIAPDRLDSSMDLIEVREPREWNVRVALSGNQTCDENQLICEQRDGMMYPSGISRWEVIRVREIID